MKTFLLNDAKAKAIIIQGVSDKHLDIIKVTKTAKEMMIIHYHFLIGEHLVQSVLYLYVLVLYILL